MKGEIITVILPSGEKATIINMLVIFFFNIFLAFFFKHGRADSIHIILQYCVFAYLRTKNVIVNMIFKAPTKCDGMDFA